MHYFHSLMAILNRWAHLGNRKTPQGIRLIGQMPSLIQRDKLIPMHVVYEPLDESDILRLETILGHALPSALRAFYTKANGFSIFGGILSMKGLRHDYSREINDKGIYQPVSLEYGNTIERPRGYSSDMTFFCWYDYDASKVQQFPEP